MRVFVYFNLHKKVWSIKALEGINKGRVIAHKNKLSVLNATFKVSQAGRNRVLREKRKNVHAGVVGQLCHHINDFSTQVSYNPYKAEYFYRKDDNTPVYGAEVVSFNDRLVTCM